MKMMMRVNKTNVGVSAMLLAVCLLVGGVATPGFAKVSAADGYAGDPGDGWGIASGGSTDRPEDNSTSTRPNDEVAKPVIIRSFGFALIPYFDCNGLHFLVVSTASAGAGSLK